MRRSALLLLALILAVSPSRRLAAQPDRGTIVIVSGQYPANPVPTLTRGSADVDIVDLVFLRLARLGPTLTTVGDRDFVPQLARRWERRDSLTVVFELDPRARWHDGRPITAEDVAWSFRRAKNAAVAPAHATALRQVREVVAEGSGRIVVRYERRYPTQLFDVIWQLPVLPSHLLDSIPPERLGTSAFVRNPIGSGPYRFVRATAGQSVELAAVPDHYLGAPRLERVIYRVASDGDARTNLLLSGEGDGLEQLSLRGQQERFATAPDFRLIPVPSFQIGYVLFNQKDPADRTTPHPVLSDQRVRRALVLALDRREIASALYGAAAQIPEGPASMSLWARTNGPRRPEGDPAAAAALFDAAGWRLAGELRAKDGRPLTLSLIFAGTSPARRLAAQLVQAQWRKLGVDVQLLPLDFAAYVERRNARNFDIDLTAVNQDPNPAGLRQGWSCGGGSNLGSYCAPGVDSLMSAAESDPRGGRAQWQEVLQRIDADAPAVFLFAPANVVAVHRRYADVVLRPESLWSGLADWGVIPSRRLARDGAP